MPMSSDSHVVERLHKRAGQPKVFRQSMPRIQVGGLQTQTCQKDHLDTYPATGAAQPAQSPHDYCPGSTHSSLQWPQTTPSRLTSSAFSSRAQQERLRDMADAPRHTSSDANLDSSTLSLLHPTSFQGALFDFDGTLADSMHIWEAVDRAFLESKGLPYTHDTTNNLAALGFEKGARYLIERYHLSDTPEQIYDAWNETAYRFYKDDVQLRPGVVDYIQMLRRHGIPTALATMNDPRVIAGVCDRTEMNDLFDHFVFGCDVARGKDEPDIFLKAASLIRVAPSSCIVFEDVVPAVMSARRVHMTTIGVRSAHAGQDWAGLKLVSHAVIDGFEGLAALVESVSPKR